MKTLTFFLVHPFGWVSPYGLVVGSSAEKVRFLMENQPVRKQLVEREHVSCVIEMSESLIQASHVCINISQGTELILLKVTLRHQLCFTALISNRKEYFTVCSESDQLRETNDQRPQISFTAPRMLSFVCTFQLPQHDRID